jgi:cell division protease FtsH
VSAQFAWLPVGYVLPDGTAIGRMETEGTGYQIVRSRTSGKTVLLLEEDTEAARWLANRGSAGVMHTEFLGRQLAIMVSSADAKPIRIADIPTRPQPLTSSEAKSLLRALADMGREHPGALWSEAIFVPSIRMCLPVEGDDDEDRMVLAMRLLTGGIEDTRLSPRQIKGFNPWLTEGEIVGFLKGFGVAVNSVGERTEPSVEAGPFRLPGRPELEAFFRDYVIDPHRLRDRYEAMGVQPPNGILLYGPPGSGKTFAVKMLATYLGWPVFELGMGEVGSPFIHQTSVRLKALFRQAIEASPSIVVVDEVDALASTRAVGLQDYKIEEISELLKLVEGAAAHGVIVVATTNRKEAIDPAFLRKGRFDHAFMVDYPRKEDVLAALESLVSERPHVPGLGLTSAAERLSGRAMSDVAWVVNEAARLAVKSAKDAIDDICLFSAISRLAG